MQTVRNIFACLVHECPDCITDLVRNLRTLDPASLVLLYNGSRDPSLLTDHFPFERHGAVLHPSPRPAEWGHLHQFALDCMKWACDNYAFDTLTIVDSDQLALRPSYSDFLASYLKTMPGTGLLGNSPAVQLPGTRVGPAEAALGEIELWRPFLRSFPDGERKFVHWCFWPSTVFTADAARDLTRLFANNAQLQDIMQKTRIWASEEIILPTLTALLGYRIAVNPCSYDYVQYRVAYSLRQIEAALDRDDVFWAHPIPRRYDDPLRRRIRERWNHYEAAQRSRAGAAAITRDDIPRLALTLPVIERMRAIEGWLEDAEADLLLAAARHALGSVPDGAIVEIGSFCGRSTVVLADALSNLENINGRKVYAIDPHDGVVGALDQGTERLPPTRASFLRNITNAGISHLVEPIIQHAFEVEWSKPIGFLFVDGLHDYFNVARDFYRFEPWLAPGALVAFHDYADYYPGVRNFVDELLARGDYEKVHQALSLVIVWAKPNAARVALQSIVRSAETPANTEYDEVSLPDPVAAQAPISRSVPTESMIASGDGSAAVSVAAQTIGCGAEEDSGSREPAREALAAPSIAPAGPLVSCIMPTANRRLFVPRAIRYFQHQDYGKRELVILDDGDQSVADLIPSDERVHYVRMDHKATMGAKHNLACELARGDVIIHWDDDDWMARWRISYQVDCLLAQPRNTLCGLAQMYFFDPFNDRAWVYTYGASERPWVSGSTFCYRRELWEPRRFPDMNEGADTVFVWGLRDASLCAHDRYDFHIGVVHAANTSPKRTEDPAWRPIPVQMIYNLLEADRAFYQSLERRSETTLL